jgi:putative tryptophan/tyrosine transport system substrate-binding protein
MKMIRKYSLILLIASFIVTAGCGEKEWEGEPVTGKRWRIDVLKYINNSYTATFENQLKLALSNAGFKEKRDFIIRIRSAQGDMSNLPLIIDAAVNEDSDLLVLFQAPTLYTAINKSPNVKKIFTLLQNPFVLGAGGSDSQHIPNLTGFYVVPPIKELLEKITECSPQIKTLGTLYMVGNEDSVDRKNELIRLASEKGIEVFAEGYNTQNDITESAAALFNKKPDAAIHLLDPAQDVTFPALFQQARSNKRPLFSVVYNMEKVGASMVASTDREEIGLKFGEMVSRIVKGEDPTTMPFENDIALTKHFATNSVYAREAGLTLPASLSAGK